VARDYREADLPARDRVLLDYAVALTCEPSERKADEWSGCVSTASTTPRS
jgi:hypothetical protein